jgi:hypothetical protein
VVAPLVFFMGPPLQNMSDSPLLPSARHKFLAYSALGVAMVCLPLVQVLNYQQSDLRQLEVERQLLDPVSQAVRGQFGLLAHRQLSALLLGGQRDMEASRQTVQGVVDAQLAALAAQLAQGQWTHALAEARDLTNDWQNLAKLVALRKIDVPQSDESHTLRQEQMLQVMDLVSLSDLTSDGSSATPAQSTRVSQAAPWRASPTLAAGARVFVRLARDVSTAKATDLDNADPKARVLPSLAAVQSALLPLALAPSSTLNQAFSEVDRTARQHLQTLQLPATKATAATTLASLNAAHAAQLHLFEQALQQRGQALTQRLHATERTRTLLLSALALLATVATSLGLGLGLGLRRQSKQVLTLPVEPVFQQHHQTNDHGAPAPSQPRVETGRVLDRLRSGRNDAPLPSAAAPAPAAPPWPEKRADGLLEPQGSADSAKG